jgi:hypothetical protein
MAFRKIRRATRKLKRSKNRATTRKPNRRNKANVNVFLPGAVEPINRVRFGNNSYNNNNPMVFPSKLNNNYKNDPAPIRIFDQVNYENSNSSNNNGYTNNPYGQGMHYRPGAYPVNVKNFSDY